MHFFIYIIFDFPPTNKIPFSQLFSQQLAAMSQERRDTRHLTQKACWWTGSVLGFFDGMRVGSRGRNERFCPETPQWGRVSLVSLCIYPMRNERLKIVQRNANSLSNNIMRPLLLSNSLISGNKKRRRRRRNPLPQTPSTYIHVESINSLLSSMGSFPLTEPSLIHS